MNREIYVLTIFDIYYRVIRISIEKSLLEKWWPIIMPSCWRRPENISRTAGSIVSISKMVWWRQFQQWTEICMRSRVMLIWMAIWVFPSNSRKSHQLLHQSKRSSVIAIPIARLQPTTRTSSLTILVVKIKNSSQMIQGLLLLKTMMQFVVISILLVLVIRKATRAQNLILKWIAKL